MRTTQWRADADSREAATHHIVVDTLGRRWLEQGSLESADGVTLRAELEHLQNVYARLHPEQESVLYAAIEAALAGRAPQTGEGL